ncbi:CvpA family protein [Rhodovulum sp. DZ06]|uniref:CvpA family protein n=1 Tax=Rhodovulum sp. DZ06 TaxID=3425126 RepID=UPI003D3592C5
MQFTIADGGIALVLLLSGMLAWNRGLVREALALGGWVLAAFASLYGAPIVEPLVQEIPAIGPWLASQCSLSKLFSFSVVFALALIILSIFTPLFSGAIQDSPLGVFDKGLGFLFGVARGLALLIIAYAVYTFVVAPDARMPEIENARLLSLIAEPAEMARAWVETTTAQLSARAQSGEAALPEWFTSMWAGFAGECEGLQLFDAPEGGPTDA